MANAVRQRAVRRIYRYLVQKAQQRQTTYYEEIAQKFQDLGLHTSGSALGATLSPILYDIFEWCKKRGQPPLTSIVVRKSGADEGIPGKGFWDALDLSVVIDLNANDKRTITAMFHQQVFDYYEM